MLLASLMGPACSSECAPTTTGPPRAAAGYRVARSASPPCICSAPDRHLLCVGGVITSQWRGSCVGLASGRGFNQCELMTTSIQE